MRYLGIHIVGSKFCLGKRPHIRINILNSKKENQKVSKLVDYLCTVKGCVEIKERRLWIL